MAYFVAFLLALVSYTLIDNVLLSRFYGICSFIGVGNKVKSAVSMGVAVVFVIVFAALICYPIYYYVLVPADLKFMDTVVYILVIASLVQIVGLFIKPAGCIHDIAVGFQLAEFGVNAVDNVTDK